MTLGVIYYMRTEFSYNIEFCFETSFVYFSNFIKENILGFWICLPIFKLFFRKLVILLWLNFLWFFRRFRWIHCRFKCGFRLLLYCIYIIVLILSYLFWYLLWILNLFAILVCIQSSTSFNFIALLYLINSSISSMVSSYYFYFWISCSFLIYS